MKVKGKKKGTKVVKPPKAKPVLKAAGTPLAY